MNPRRSKRRIRLSLREFEEAKSADEMQDDLSPEAARRVQEQLLERIAQGASLCREIESQLRQHPAPELETIIKVFRVLVLKLSAEARAVPELRHLVSSLIKPVMEWARLEEKRKARELVEQRRCEEAAAQKAATDSAQDGRDRALRPETLEKIEHELELF